MKLRLKLQLAFSALLTLIIILAGTAWYSIWELSKQNEILASVESSLSSVYIAEINFGKGIAARDASLLDTTISELEEAINHLQKPQSLLKGTPRGKDLDADILELQTLSPLVRQVMQGINKGNELITKVTQYGDKVEISIQSMVSSSNETLLQTGDLRIGLLGFRLAELAYDIGQTKQAFAHFMLSNDPTSITAMFETLDVGKAALQKLRNTSRSVEEINSMTAILEIYESYYNSLIEFVQILEVNNKISDETIQKASHVAETGLSLAKRSLDSFRAGAKTTTTVLLLVTAFSIIFGMILAFFLNRNVLKQLGTDPSMLASLSQRVAQGDYDVDDHKPHIGVYNDFINMVNEVKKAIDFSRGILKELPVPCVVFGPDNRLQFVNQDMLNILEHDKKPEDYIGYTSGHFMCNDENFRTGVVMSMEAKKSFAVKRLFDTMKGNQLYISTVVSPIFNRKGDITNVICIWRDVHEETLNLEKIESTTANMQQVAKELQHVASVTATTMNSLSDTIQVSGDGAHEQAERVSVTATALEEMNATVLEVARSANTTANGAASVKGEATAGSESMQACVRAMHNVRDESLKLKNEMGTLSGHAQAINEIMNVISDIADQTNLLALNAAIEAARAGDAGRGFAVVADEVRKLAEKTMTSTTDVGNAIASIQKSTSDNTRLVEGAVEKIENVTEMVAGVGQALVGIVSLADSTAEQISSIATASEEQSATSEEITRSIEEVNSIATTNAEAMTQAAQAVGELVQQTQVLNELIAKLDVAENA